MSEKIPLSSKPVEVDKEDKNTFKWIFSRWYFYLLIVIYSSTPILTQIKANAQMNIITILCQIILPILAADFLFLLFSFFIMKSVYDLIKKKLDSKKIEKNINNKDVNKQ